MVMCKHKHIITEIRCFDCGILIKSKVEDTEILNESTEIL
jgi:DNA-directed RNA polymerase subunit N (RpoN/RPB10)